MEKIQGKLIIVDDNKAVLHTLKLLLSRLFNSVLTLTDPTLLPALLHSGDTDLVLLDMNFGIGQKQGKEGLFWLKRMAEIPNPPAVILITAYGDVPLAVEALKNGAADFIQKPWDNEKLEQTVLRVFRDRQTHMNQQIELALATDIPPTELLLRALLSKYAEMYAKPLPTLTPQASKKLTDLLRNHGLRVLEEVIERTILWKDQPLLDLTDFLDITESSETSKMTLEEMEKQFIASALKAHKRNLTLVAQELSISRQTLYNKMKKYSL